MTKEYRVMMADMPVTGVFKKKANSLEAAWKIVEFYRQTAVPYQNFYIEEWDVELVKTHYGNGVCGCPLRGILDETN